MVRDPDKDKDEVFEKFLIDLKKIEFTDEEVELDFINKHSLTCDEQSKLVVDFGSVKSVGPSARIHSIEVTQ